MFIEYYPSGKIKSIEWKDNDTLHREDGPAVVRYAENGTVLEEVWLNKGKPHRDGGPAVIWRNASGTQERLEWFVSGMRHRLDGPAFVLRETLDSGGKCEERWYTNGHLHREGRPAVEVYVLRQEKKIPIAREWWQQGKRHRAEGPAEELFYPSGVLRTRKWFHNDLLHREDGPAVEEFFENGALRFYEWYHHGKLHREDGPAREVYGTSINHRLIATRKYFYLDGELIPPSDFRRRARIYQMSRSLMSASEHHLKI